MSKYGNSYDRILDIESESIRALKDSLDKKVLDQIVDLLCTVKDQGRKVITAGCGTSGTVARRIAHTLCVVEVPAFYCSPSNSIHGGMGAIQKGDIVVLISKGGNTPEILNYIPVCKKKGALIIAVTQNDQSILAKNCDILMKVVVEREADIWNMIASGSIVL
jgi:D-arabinose 5-phosphate isomerase GutQ